jgi:hypothetical protein
MAYNLIFKNQIFRKRMKRQKSAVGVVPDDGTGGKYHTHPIGTKCQPHIGFPPEVFQCLYPLWF